MIKRFYVSTTLGEYVYHTDWPKGWYVVADEWGLRKYVGLTKEDVERHKRGLKGGRLCAEDM